MKWLSAKSNKARVSFLVSVFLILILAATLLPACKAGPEDGVENGENGGIRLTLVSGWPGTSTINDLLEVYVERVNEEGKGKVFIDYLGGPEVTPITEAVALVRNRVYDMAYSTPGYYAGLCPESVMLYYVPLDPVLLREIGVTAMADEFHREKIGVTLAGFLGRGEEFAIIAKEPINSADFSGILMHTLPIFHVGIAYLGAATTTLDVSEFYVALQTGVVDAVPCPFPTIPYEYMLYDVADYILFPQIPITATAQLLVNAERWDGLPEDVRNLLIDKMVETEGEVIEHENAIISDYTAKLLDEGMEIIELPSAEAEKFVYAFTDYTWGEFAKKHPEYGPALYELCKPYLGQ
jgi:TRAP-type C4-dicarboxylate transport system substrate-binding protein